MAEFELHPEILQTATGSIPGDIAQIQTAVYGREVRASIAECLYLLHQSCEQSASELAEIQTELADLENLKNVVESCEQSLEDYRQETDQKLKNIEEVSYPYLYPNVTGNDTLSVSDAVWIQEFITSVGVGHYTNDAAGWAEFATENDLDGNDYPDINGDGIVSSEETSLILEFSANAKVGKYSDSKAGWNAFLSEKTRIDTQTVLQELSTEVQVLKSKFVPVVSLTQEAYDALESPDENTLYVIIQAES